MLVAMGFLGRQKRQPESAHKSSSDNFPAVLQSVTYRPHFNLNQPDDLVVECNN